MRTSWDLDEFSFGILIGVLVGEGHFGGDGRQPQITLRMHTKHERLFRWLEQKVPQGKLYGPYTHGGRSYFQWMVRGAYLRETLAPRIADRLGDLDDHAASRFAAMCSRYGIAIPEPAGPAGTGEPAFPANSRSEDGT
jgi:hypothetical protein